LQGIKRTGSLVEQRGGKDRVGIPRAGAVQHLLDQCGFQTAGARQTPACLGHFFHQKLLVR
jgi:hypothetical protein